MGRNSVHLVLDKYTISCLLIQVCVYFCIAMSTTEITVTKPIRLKPKQKICAELYFDPASSTFGNLAQSAKLAGFRPSYAKTLSNARNLSWLSAAQAMYATKFEPEHIIQGVQNIALTSQRDDTRLRAYEMLGKFKGMFIDRQQTEVNVTFTNAVPRPVTEVIDVVEAEIVK
jgi:hypothetical protein